MLDKKLIESALQLTNKTMDDMEEAIHKPNTTGKYKFSIEKFCYYLLSPEFIEKYIEYVPSNWCYSKRGLYSDFGIVIGEYQRRDEEYPEGNETPLIELLKRICPTDQTM